jgi:hypothetical protein
MLRRTWNAFLDAIETVVEFVDYLAGPNNKLDRESRIRKAKPIEQ